MQSIGFWGLGKIVSSAKTVRANKNYISCDLDNKFCHLYLVSGNTDFSVLPVFFLRYFGIFGILNTDGCIGIGIGIPVLYATESSVSLRCSDGRALNDCCHQQLGRSHVDNSVVLRTRNRKHRRAAAKPAACAKPLMLSRVGRKGNREGE